jgi:hypothetical protein
MLGVSRTIRDGRTRTEGEVGGERRSADFPMRRIDCD